MNRENIIDAILSEFVKHDPAHQESVFLEALKRIASDSNLIAFAMDMGIDTNAVVVELKQNRFFERIEKESGL